MLEEFMIGHVPVNINGELRMITPVFKNYVEEVEESDYINYKKYKNKYVLCDYCYDSLKNKIYYKDYIFSSDFLKKNNSIKETYIIQTILYPGFKNYYKVLFKTVA